MAGEMAKFAGSMDFGMVLRIAYWFTLGWRYGSGYTHTRVGIKRVSRLVNAMDHPDLKDHACNVSHAFRNP